MDEFRCYAAGDGELLWTLTYPAPGNLDYGNTPRATPLVHDGLAYLLGAFGDLYCVEAATGNLVWSTNFERDFGPVESLPWGACGSPLLVDGQLIVTPGTSEASIVSLDAKTGSVNWKCPGGPPAYGSFVTHRGGTTIQIVGHDRHSLGGWDLETGERLWSLEPEIADDFNVPTPVVVGDRLLVTSENNGTRLYAFGEQGPIKTQPVARNSELASDIGTPIVVGDRVYAAWGKLFCLDLSNDLQTIWTASDPAYRTYASLMTDGERLLVAGASGQLLLLDATAEDYRVVSRMQIFDTRNAELYSHPALAGRRLYWRGDDSLKCIDLAP